MQDIAPTPPIRFDPSATGPIVAIGNEEGEGG